MKDFNQKNITDSLKTALVPKEIISSIVGIDIIEDMELGKIMQIENNTAFQSFIHLIEEYQKYGSIFITIYERKSPRYQYIWEPISLQTNEVDEILNIFETVLNKLLDDEYQFIENTHVEVETYPKPVRKATTSKVTNDTLIQYDDISLISINFIPNELPYKENYNNFDIPKGTVSLSFWFDEGQGLLNFIHLIKGRNQTEPLD